MSIKLGVTISRKFWQWITWYEPENLDVDDTYEKQYSIVNL